MTIIISTPERRDCMAAMMRYAADLVQAYPQAGPRQISDKLLTVFTDTAPEDRWTVAVTVIGLLIAA